MRNGTSACSVRLAAGGTAVRTGPLLLPMIGQANENTFSDDIPGVSNHRGTGTPTRVFRQALGYAEDLDGVHYIEVESCRVGAQNQSAG